MFGNGKFTFWIKKREADRDLLIFLLRPDRKGV